MNGKSKRVAIKLHARIRLHGTDRQQWTAGGIRRPVRVVGNQVEFSGEMYDAQEVDKWAILGWNCDGQLRQTYRMRITDLKLIQALS